MASWTIIVPIKPLPAAKTRLRGTVPGAEHPDLVLAMAQDTVAAALAGPAVARVLVVCDDERVAKAMIELGADCIPDQPGRGLNAAIRHGAQQTGGDVAALTADLPALRAAELEEALDEVAGRAFVPDAEGTGTVLLAARAGHRLDPHFGPGSAAAHEQSGARRLDKNWPSLRRDIDTPADLERGRELGLGPRTEEAIT